jgi:hypothetical protein
MPTHELLLLSRPQEAIEEKDTVYARKKRILVTSIFSSVVGGRSNPARLMGFAVARYGCRFNRLNNGCTVRNSRRLSNEIPREKRGTSGKSFIAGAIVPSKERQHTVSKQWPIRETAITGEIPLWGGLTEEARAEKDCQISELVKTFFCDTIGSS